MEAEGQRPGDGGAVTGPAERPGGGDPAPTSRTSARQRLRAFRWYASEPGARRRRRPTDVVLLVLGVLGLVLLAIPAPGPGTLDLALTSVVEAMPSLVTWVLTFGYALATLWAVLLLLVAAATPRRLGMAGQMLLGALMAFGCAVLAGLQAGAAWDDSVRSLWSTEPPQQYPAARVAVLTAVIVVASPHLSRPIRFVGRALLVAVACGAVAVGIAYSIGAVAGFLSGVVGAAVAHLLMGSPAGRPSPRRVAEALDDLGIEDAEVTDLAATTPAATGYAAVAPGRAPLLVSVLGRDDWDAQVVGSLWTAATVRGERVRIGSSRLERVEHAAMMSLLAERAGARVLPVVTVGWSAEGDAVLVVEAPGPSLGELDRSLVTDELLEDLWAQLQRMHDAGLAVGRVDDRRIVLDRSGRPALGDLSDATVGAEHRLLMIDRARLLVTTALVSDAERAVATARSVIGEPGLVELLPFLQLAALDRRTRSRVRDPYAGEERAPDAGPTLSEIRDAVLGTTGVTAPPLEQISRVTAASLLRAGILVLLTYFLISLVSGVDLQAVVQEISDADWAWLAAALVVSPLAQVSFAFSTIGATTASLRYFPVLMLQYAVQFIALILPSTAARIALDVRFFESFGVASGAAVSLGMIDSFSGFVVQVILLAVILLSGLPGLTAPLTSSTSSSSDSGSSGSSPSLLALAVGIALVSVLVVLIVPRLRRRFSGRIRAAWTATLEQLRHARGALDVLRHPGKVGEMLAGNLGGQVVQAVVLGLCLQAFGYEAHLSQLILINTGVSLFAGLMPVPGGMGVAEAGYTAGLQAIGIPAPAAMSTAIAFRLVTFYLPPIWGSMSMRWLRRHSYV